MRYILPFVIIVLLLISCSTPKEEISESIVQKNIYGLQVDSLNESHFTVQKNETLSDILLPYGFSLQMIYAVADSSRNKFDVKNIRQNKDYYMYTTPDTLETLKFFVYEIDQFEYVVYDFSDSISVYLGRKEVETRENTLSGTINSSLYNTLKDEGGSDLLASKMADVFAWQIDFYSIQPGDFFKVLYEENYIAGKSVGVGKILAGVFNHRGKDYYAFRYESGETRDYFDEQGNSLRKAFLKAPLKFSRISSRFTNNRFHPVLKYYRPHKGIDYAAPAGTPVQSIGDGVVTDVKWTTQGGRFVRVKHNSVYASGYMHLSKYAKGITPGKTIHQGDLIGYVGSSGLATGPHLDFRFWKNGQLVNFLKQDFPSSNPIADSLKVPFFAYKDSLKIMIDSVKVGAQDTSSIAITKNLME